MKIYIGNKKIEDQSYQALSDVQVLNYVADDSECLSIVLDDALSKQSLNEVVETLKLCMLKLRINGTLQIIDTDFDILTYLYDRSGKIKDLNAAIFQSGSIGSFLTLDLMKEICSGLGLIIKSVAINNFKFVLECTRQ